MTKKLQNKKVVNPQSRGGSTARKLSSINIDMTNVFIFIFLLGFWRAGEGQSVFLPGGGAISGDVPVMINTTNPVLDTALITDGQIYFNSLNTGTLLINFLGRDGTGKIYEQQGSLPDLGTLTGQTLYWNGGVSWLPTDFMTTVPGTGVGIGTATPIDRLHLDESMGVSDNFVRWTNNFATSGGKIGQPTGSTTFQIRQEENDDMEFLVNNTSVVYMNLQAGSPFLGVGRNTPVGLAANPNFAVEEDLEVNGDAWCTSGSWTTSDINFKKNVIQVQTWKPLLNLNAYTYEYTNERNKELNFGKGLYSGFIAQEVESTLPHLVRQTKIGLAVNYQGFIPYLTEGLKEHEERLNAVEQQNNEPNSEIEELKVENEQLKGKNEQLENRLATLEEKFNAICNLPCIQNNPALNGNDFGQTGTLGEPPVLEQNQPNPFTQETVIRFFVPENAKDARIEVKNIEGKIVGSFAAQSKGHGSLTLKAGSLTAGTYYYSLIIGDRVVDTKKMILLN